MKKYYWLKFKIDFFADPKIKKLRRIPGGDTYTIIYQKLLLLSVPHGGILALQGIEDSLADELSLILDETAEAIGICWAFLLANKMVEEINRLEYFMSSLQSMIGSESDSAERKRRQRLREKSQGNQSVTLSHACPKSVTTEKEIDIYFKNIYLSLEKISFQDFLALTAKISKDIPKIIEVANALGLPTFEDGSCTQYGHDFKPLKVIDSNGEGEAFALDEVQVEEIQNWLFANRVKYFQLIAQKLQELPP